MKKQLLSSLVLLSVCLNILSQTAWTKALKQQLDFSQLPVKKTVTILRAPKYFDYNLDSTINIWNYIANENILANFKNDALNANPLLQFRLPNNASDFSCSWKAIYDDLNLYVLLRCTDDNITGKEQFQIMWATYPNSYKPVKDTALSTRWLNAAYGRWGNAGAWNIKWGKKGAISGDDYRNCSNLVDAAAGLYGEIKPNGASIISLKLTGNFINLSANQYAYLAVIPWKQAMANFVPSPDTAISLEIKATDIDDNRLPIEGYWNAQASQTDVEWAIYNAGIVRFSNQPSTSTWLDHTNVSQTLNAGIAFYPNPVNNILKISTTQQLKYIQVSNMLGQEVLHLSNPANEINMSALEKGIYFIKTVDSNNHIYVNKIVKK